MINAMTRIVVTKTISESLRVLKASIVDHDRSPCSGKDDNVVFTGFSPLNEIA
ncbi:hypothetical protein GNF18_02615 [Ligilactobacillus pobuzihii]|uniref:hypothetical protein n=1 Tax=Ligilactobacillus pobuzihii TaxID=449659 RepID=UPI0019D2EBC6|nr:hypothetical protein [Ligilactobacillus pobuzihii]MBN7274066.1 hypothetical protein [Ligilactobacillus pobuzihii]